MGKSGNGLPLTALSRKDTIMAEKQKWKGGAMLAPLPAVMVTCGSLDKPNIITIGWTGILCTNPPKTYISVRPERYSYELIKKTGKFVINLTTASLARACDFCGVRSGRDTDKFAESAKLYPGGLHAVPALELEDTPMLAESPVSIECRVSSVMRFEDAVLPDGTKKRATHEMFIADIVSVAVDPSLIDEKGALHLERAGLAAYAHGDYFALGKKIGDFGFSVRKKRAPKSGYPQKGAEQKKDGHSEKDARSEKDGRPSKDARPKKDGYRKKDGRPKKDARPKNRAH